MVSIFFFIITLGSVRIFVYVYIMFVDQMTLAELLESDTPQMDCELCHVQTTNLNRHMRTQHPGCGGKLLVKSICNIYMHIKSCTMT